VETAEQFLRASSAQIQAMKIVRDTLGKPGQTARLIRRGPNLYVLPSAIVDMLPHAKEQVIQFA
jgi:hypothetical protein